MLSKNLINFRRVLLVGIIVLSLLSNILPFGIALGEGAFALLLFMLLTYFFEVAFYDIKIKD